MSAVPSAIAHDVEAAGTEAPRLAPKAAGYFFVVAAVTMATAVPLLSRLSPHTPGWATFVILGAIAALAQLFVVRTPREPVVPHDDRLPDPGRAAAPAGARRADRRRPAHPRVAEEPLAPGTSRSFNICNYTLVDAGRVGGRRTAILRLAPSSARRVRRSPVSSAAVVFVGRQPPADRPDAAPGARPLAPGVGPVLVPEPLDRPRARDARRRRSRAFWDATRG